jgi:hypothetical protein
MSMNGVFRDKDALYYTLFIDMKIRWPAPKF